MAFDAGAWAREFIDLGGRLMLAPQEKFEVGFNIGLVLDVKVPEDLAQERWEVLHRLVPSLKNGNACPNCS